MAKEKKKEALARATRIIEDLESSLEDEQYINGQLSTEIAQLNNDLDQAQNLIERYDGIVNEQSDKIEELLDIAADSVVLELTTIDFYNDENPPVMTLGDRILELVDQDWQNVSNLVYELGVPPKDIKEELRYLEEEGKIGYYNFSSYRDTIGKPSEPQNDTGEHRPQ